MSQSTGALWRHPDFLNLWIGQAGSAFGSNVGGFALDLTAVLTLHASPGQMAMLNGALFLPPVLVTPLAGIWADRFRRRPLLLLCDAGRALSLGSIPAAALSGHLVLTYLYVAAAICSALTAVFTVTYRAYLPAMIGADLLVDANGAMQGTAAVAETAGFGIAGLLVQRLTAPMALAVDAVSFLLSAVTIAGTRGDTPERRDAQYCRRIDPMAGSRVVWHDPVLRALLATALFWDLASGMIGVVIVLFFVRDLHLPPIILGPLFGLGGISSLFGALLAGRLGRRFPLRRVLVAALYVDTAGMLPVVLAAGPLTVAALLVALGQVTDAGRAVYEIHALSLVQQRTPHERAGAVNAVFQSAQVSALAVGLVIGGVLGNAIGLRPTLIVAFGLELLLPLCLLRSNGAAWAEAGERRGDPARISAV